MAPSRSRADVIGGVTAALPEQFRQMMPEGMPPEFLQMLQPMMGMVRQLGAAAFSMQVGQALSALASQVLCASDIGIPLTDPPRVAMLPANIAEFAEGLEIASSDAMMYIALRESAHQRLFVHVPWLAARVLGAVEQYAQYMRVDSERLGDVMGDVDMTDPAALQQVLSQGLLQPEDTPEQTGCGGAPGSALGVHRRMGGRRRPASAAGIGCRPPVRSSRRCVVVGPLADLPSALSPHWWGWNCVRACCAKRTQFSLLFDPQRGADARDALWSHPDLLPGPRGSG